MPGVFVSTYSPVHAGSVPAWRSTRNSAGVSRTRHSSSVVGRVVSSVAMPPRYVDRTARAAHGQAPAVEPFMEAESPARFRPTRRQALGRGLYLGALASVAAASIALVATLALEPPGWLWATLTFGPPLAGLLAGVLVRRRSGTEIDARGIRTTTRGMQPWSRVVDLRAERRGARTVVSVYLDSGASVRLSAPYSGELFAADPQFELKVLTLSHLWRAHRFGGVPS